MIYVRIIAGTVAQGKHASQSSVEGTGDASHAIDDTIESCSETQSTTNHWWSVDLERRYHVHSVTIHGGLEDNTLGLYYLTYR